MVSIAETDADNATRSRIHVVHLTTANLAPSATSALPPSEAEVKDVLPASGRPALESNLDAAAAIPAMLNHVREAADDADAIVLACFGDPGLVLARDLSSTPVVGLGQAAMLVAAMLAENFSVIVPDDQSVVIVERLARAYALDEKLCSVRSLHGSVEDIVTADPDRLREIADAACAAIEEDGAHAVVLGCAGFAALDGALRHELEARGHGGIPIVEPVSTAIHLARTLASLGLCHSKRSYPAPPARASRETGDE